MIELDKNIETLAIELDRAKIDPADIAQFGVEMHVRTTHASLIMPEYIKRQYRHVICLALQRQFSGIKLDEGGFMVTLRFSGQPETLYIPWDAIIGWKWAVEKPKPKPTLAQFLQETGPVKL